MRLKNDFGKCPEEDCVGGIRIDRWGRSNHKLPSDPVDAATTTRSDNTPCAPGFALQITHLPAISHPCGIFLDGYHFSRGLWPRGHGLGGALHHLLPQIPDGKPAGIEMCQVLVRRAHLLAQHIFVIEPVLNFMQGVKKERIVGSQKFHGTVESAHQKGRLQGHKSTNIIFWRTNVSYSALLARRRISTRGSNVAFSAAKSPATRPDKRGSCTLGNQTLGRWVRNRCKEAMRRYCLPNMTTADVLDMAASKSTATSNLVTLASTPMG
jgi:hypothetical protein